MTSHVVSDDELGWHEAEVAGRPGTSICSVVSAHAASRPDRPAVIDPDGRHLTYRELQWRSGCLAARLAADGVGPGSCVGVFLERSSEFVVAAYALTGTLTSPNDTAPLHIARIRLDLPAVSHLEGMLYEKCCSVPA